jgi:E3 ubiquitin-protein ligase RNF115/126
MSTANNRMFWCHECGSQVKPHANSISCPSCGGEFLEEITEDTMQTDVDNTPPVNNQPQQPDQQQNVDPIHQFVNNVFNSFGIQPPPMAQQRQNQPNVQQFVFQQPVQIHFQHGFHGANPFAQQQNRNQGVNNGQPPVNPFMGLFQQMLGIQGNNIIGDYAFGNIDGLLNTLFQNQKPATRAACKRIVDDLDVITIDQSDVDKKLECAICKDEYALEDKVKVLPCNHLFHGQCIDKWLENSNVCPICRYEFETDDPEYDQMRKDRRAQMTSSSNSTPNTNTTVNNTSVNQQTAEQNNANNSDNTSNNNNQNNPPNSGSGSSANLSYFS